MLLLDQFRNWLHFNFHYLGNPPWDKNQSPPELIDYINTHEPGIVLDLGCGTGKNCLTLAEADWQTTGVDFALKAILHAKRRFEKAGLKGKFLLSDVSRLKDMDENFDLVLDMGCYHVLPEYSRQNYQTVVNRVLKPGGTFLLFGHMNSRFSPNSKRLTMECIDQFQRFLVLERRLDGEDSRGRIGVWLWFKKHGK
jgi:cyclopropane fatty-acyl-phospholipid synthase-like methyltransferase